MSTINLNPTGIYQGYEYSANGSGLSSVEGVYIPLSQINNLETSEANQSLSTSDYRKLLWGLLDKAYEELDAEEEVPSNMTISRSGLTFVGDNQAQRSYSITFQFEIDSLDVKPES